MKTVSVSEFKAKCLSILASLRESGEVVWVTKRGRLIARILPPPAEEPRKWLGRLTGTARIRGDLVPPAAPAEAWEAHRK